MSTSPPAPFDRRAPLVRLLEDSFASDDAEPTCSGEVPAALWDRALLDPLREFLGRPSKEFRAQLVGLAFHAGGGTTHPPPELPLLIESLHAGSLIIDDIEDDSDLRRGAAALHRRHGVPVALNAGNWLYFWAQVRLSRLPLDDATRLIAYERLSSCLLRCHEGQALDLTVRVTDLEQAQVPSVVFAITRLKTGSLMALATALGALAAGARGQRLEAIASFGRAAGVGLQMLDDLSGIVNPKRRDKAHEDLLHARATWVWAWLATDLPADRYHALRDELEASDPAAMPRLIGHIAEALSDSGQRRAREQLSTALMQLRQAVGDGPWSIELGREIERLQDRYVTG
ncbi:MAG TPA: polyprenyl synthetase family protein [Terriglobales bacterium]|nr:polyprenyl synthetase family protein [Terriglobales bacterium]